MLGPEYKDKEIKSTTQLAERAGFVGCTGEPVTSRDRTFVKEIEHGGGFYKVILGFHDTTSSGKWIDLGVSLGTQCWTTKENIEKIAPKENWDFPKNCTRWGFPNEYLRSGGYEAIARFLESEFVEDYLGEQIEGLLSERNFGRGVMEVISDTAPYLFPEFSYVQNDYSKTKELFLYSSKLLKGKADALRFRLAKVIEGSYKLVVSYARASLEEDETLGGKRLNGDSFGRSRILYEIWNSIDGIVVPGKDGGEDLLIGVVFKFKPQDYDGLALCLYVMYDKIESYFKEHWIEYK